MSICLLASGNLFAESSDQTGELNSQAGKSLVQYYQPVVPFDATGQPNLVNLSQCAAIKRRESRSSEIRVSSSDRDSSETSMLYRHLSADSAPIMTSEETKLIGNVVAIDQSSILRADSLHSRNSRQEVSATGNVSYESEKMFFSATRLLRDQEQQSMQIEDALFFLFTNNANGHADQILVKNDSQVELSGLNYSTCPVDEPAWKLSAGKMIIDQEEGEGQAWHTLLRVKDVPILYLPYISFPTDDRRKSGLLSPTLKSVERDGINFALPYYWNIAPHTDATFAPRFIEKRGSGLDGQFRYLTQKSESEYDFAWLAKDKLLQQQTDVPNGAVSDEDTQRWFSHIQNKTQFNSNWQLNINAQRVSDTGYFRDFSNGIESANAIQLESQARLSYRDDIWQIDAFTLSHQSLIGRESYQYLPSIRANADYLTDNGWQLLWATEATSFEHKDNTKLIGQRYHTVPGIAYPMRASWGFATPKMRYHVSQYTQQNQLTNESTRLSREIPEFTLDSGIYLDRSFSFAEKNYIHSLEPRLFYAYIPYEEQSSINLFDTTQNDFGFNRLWQANRFSGIDRIGDTNQVSVSLTNRFLEDATGAEKVSFTLGRVYYLEAPQMSLDGSDLAPEEQKKHSPWLAQMNLSLSSAFSLSGLVEYDSEQKKTNRAQTQLNFEPKANHIVNLSHRYRDVDGKLHEELDFAFALPINERWRLLGRWYNDLNRGQMIEALAGVEYESCCWAVRLVGQKYLNSQLDAQGMPLEFGDDKYHQGIYLQVIFKGLGSAGRSGVKDVLTSSIVGYKDRFVDE